MMQVQSVSESNLILRIIRKVVFHNYFFEWLDIVKYLDSIFGPYNDT